MALLSSFLTLSPTLPSTSTSLPSSFPIRLQSLALGFPSTFEQNFHIHAPLVAHKTRGAVIAKASADPDEPATASGDGDSTDEEEKIGIQNLPLESKLQLKLEQKMKMKIDKKIRLRRKRLIRKRMMRKKGRWPPSKMKKLKNV
ncbi:large ribosomal subunit protein cL37 alpha-like [Silene latifolia]|uniref:large ribosomal subunit protein cL37 alpha-like n=1 Tax=Silene latifolia TaxID=37657 RepID=UPI003D775FD0